MKQLLAVSRKIDKIVCYVSSYNFVESFNFYQVSLPDLHQ